jgi:hypothetical protein
MGGRQARPAIDQSSKQAAVDGSLLLFLAIAKMPRALQPGRKILYDPIPISMAPPQVHVLFSTLRPTRVITYPHSAITDSGHGVRDNSRASL